MKIRILLTSALALVCVLCVLLTSSCCCCISEEDLDDILDEMGMGDLLGDLEGTLNGTSTAFLEFRLNEGYFTYAVAGIAENAPTSIVIPDTYNGYPVTQIDAYAFENSNITSITIPPSVMWIGVGAFYNCLYLQSVIFNGESQLAQICDDAFYGCSGLNSITLPASTKQIDDRAFCNCSSLSSVAFGAGTKELTRIGESAFQSCYSLSYVTIPAAVTTIGAYAFSDCNRLEAAGFGSTSGWSVYGTYIPAESLDTPSIAAYYLVYYTGEWYHGNE